MTEAPFGYRRPEDKELLTGRVQDPEIVPDYVSPAVEGYFRIPAIWVESAPNPSAVKVLNPAVHHGIIFQSTLRCGVKVCVLRDGTFLFDFSEWKLAPIVRIPGYRKPSVSEPYRVPLETHHAEEMAESHAILRAQAMNVHQACLSTAEAALRQGSTPIGFPITAWNTFKALRYGDAVYYHDDGEDIRALARNIINNKDYAARSAEIFRRVVKLEVVKLSMEFLDDILSRDDVRLIRIVEAAYLAECRRRDKGYGEALLLAWGVNEQLLSIMWSEVIAEARQINSDRMTKERREKLKGRDYTASVMIESLELTGRIDHDIYRMLEVARKARNKWAHEMRVPKESELRVCMQAAERLLSQVANIRFRLSSFGRGGVPQWPIWMYEKEVP